MLQSIIKPFSAKHRVSSDPTTRQEKLTVLAVALLTLGALVLRLAWMLHYNTLWLQVSGDEPDYQSLANSLLSGHGFSIDGVPITSRSPLYPLFLAGVQWVFGPSPVVVRIIQAILSALCVPLVYRIGALTWDRRTGLVAALLYTTSVFILPWPAFLYPENTAMLLLIVAGAMLVRGSDTSSIQLFGVGILVGLQALARSQGIAVALAVIIWLGFAFYRKYGLRAATLRALALSVGGIVLVLLPWIMRNYVTFHQLVPLTTGKYASTGGYVFWTANNEITAAPGPMQGQWIPDRYLAESAEYQKLDAHDFGLIERKGYEYGLKFLSSHPAMIPGLVMAKARSFWDYGWIFGVIGSPGPLALFFLPLFLFGVVLIGRNIEKSGPTLAIVLGTFLICLIYYGSVRFRAPAEPFITIVVAVGTVKLIQVLGVVGRLRYRRQEVKQFP